MPLPTRSHDTARGAYGLALRGVEAADELLVAVPGDAPRWELRSQRGRAGSPREHVDEEHARLVLRSGGEVLIDRRAGTALFRVPHAVRADELVHPYLAPVAAVVGRWLGRESVHAGAVVVGGAAWGVIGERGAGKSSTLAWLAGNGHDVICDDMLLVDGPDALAGPRSIDLRADAAGSLGLGEFIGVTGARERWRLRLGPVAPRVVLGGWVFLAWGDRVEARRLAPAERLARLFPHRGVRLAPTRPEALVEFAAMPAWELRRPAGWASLAPAADRLLELAAG